MLPCIAIPIRPNGLAHGLDLLSQATKLSPDFIEVWCDLMSLDESLELVAKSEVPLIVNLKSADERGNYQGSDTDKINYLLALSKSASVAYVDFSWSLLLHFGDKIRQSGFDPKKIIASYHNFVETPSAKELLELLTKVELPVGLIKVATQINGEEDFARLLRFYLNHRSEYEGRLTIMGMGELGEVTRVMAPILGVPLTFAALDSKNTTAPGQIAVSELMEQWKKLKF